MGQAMQQRPVFFVSYVHVDDKEDQYVHRFHDDLVREVRVQGGPRSSSGYSDKLLRLGDQWSPKLVEAISTCQVFIALCSHTYFASRPCGREWTLFTRRLDPRAHSSLPLLPLIWVKMDPVPDFMQPYQYSEPGLGGVYRDHGLRDLLRMTKYSDDYNTFVSVVARRVLALQAVPVPPDQRRPDFDSVDSAFHRSVVRGDPPAPPPARSEPDAVPAQRQYGSMPRLNPADPPRPRVDQPPAGGAQPGPNHSGGGESR